MISVFLNNGRVEVRVVPRPRRARGSALIRFRCGGICNTDLELQRGYYGFKGVPGHEFVGDVVDADDKALVGKRVVGEINLSCGRCPWCRKGLGRHCPQRQVLGIVRHPGAFREFLALPESNLHVVPDRMPDEVAVFAEPTAAACEILDQIHLSPSTEVAVLGDGKLGLLVSQVLKAHGLNVHQFGRHQEKLRIAQRAGIPTEIIPRRLPAAAYECVVEATGSPEGLQQAVRMVRPRGVVVMKSTIHDAVSMDTAPVIVNEVVLLGSRCGRFEPALRLLRQGKINVIDMISDSFPLDAAPRAFERAAQKGVLKVLLTKA
jgi:alcohol dehydrogenase